MTGFGFSSLPGSFIAPIARSCLLVAFLTSSVGGCIVDTPSSPPEHVVQQLGPLLDHPQAEMRRTAAMSLGKIRHPSSIPFLVKGLRDPDALVRQYSAWGLGNLGETLPEEATRLLAQRLAEDEDPEVQQAAAHALAQTAPLAVTADVLTPLEKALDAPDVQRRRAAIRTLGGMESPAAYNLLTKALEDPDAMVRQQALAALGELADPRALPYIRRLARHDPDPAVRAEAAFRLGKLGSHDEIPMLEHIVVTDPNASVRRWGTWAISYIDPSYQS